MMYLLCSYHFLMLLYLSQNKIRGSQRSETVGIFIIQFSLSPQRPPFGRSGENPPFPIIHSPHHRAPGGALPPKRSLNRRKMWSSPPFNWPSPSHITSSSPRP